ncbi:hypothetical protein [Streptomyces europaeiscabiei]|nr:hypothetical protein [Streptomyces europaeiscabiei]MDX2768564.1 hypothetical protein [Streptomyces europaeiscabiei]MDX3708325.1 hypothetical protein [Streptomyces europaeiscabiei]
MGWPSRDGGGRGRGHAPLWPSGAPVATVLERSSMPGDAVRDALDPKLR